MREWGKPMNLQNMILKRNRFKQDTVDNEKKEAGQSIVLIALALIAIIAFMGIAIDVGFIFARGSQLQAAIDSASLAGAPELSGWAPGNSNNPAVEQLAKTKSGQFMNANGLPLTVTQSIGVPGNLHVEQTPLGAVQYAITATWPVETYFLKVIGFNQPINLTRSATSAIFSQADIYASRRIEDGIISTSNQSVFGQNICTDYGDPYSPSNSPWSPGPHEYKYRILIPEDYNYDELRIEILDPDTHNTDHDDVTIARSNNAIAEGMDALTNGTCGNRKNACILDTGELDLVDDGTLPLDLVNPFWFMAIDENRGTGAAPGNGSCGQPGSYDSAYNTRTLFELYYFQENADGTVQRVDLATYTGLKDNTHDTDMRWVTPGGPESYDQSTFVPADPGSTADFQLDIDTDLQNIVTDQSTGARYVNLDVTALEGASENGFELWAGPPSYINSVPSEANGRNLHVINTPGTHSSQGATVFGSGNLPMNSNFDFAVDIPLIYVGPEYAGQDIFVSLFDPDSGAVGPITFFFDSIAESDWSLTFADPDEPVDPDGVSGRCQIGNPCNNQWVNPPYRITVPGLTDDCDYSDPTDPDCVPFYGGRLTAHYQSGTGDTYGWQISVSGLPYLVD